MSFFWASFLTALRSRLSDWRVWALLLLLPGMTFGTRALLPAEEVSTPVRVGVVLPEEGGGDFWARLEARSGLAVTFYRSDEEHARQRVAAGQWDCALILPDDFQDRLARQDADQLFTLLIGPGSAVYPLVRETAAACAAELLSPGIAERYLLDSGIAGETELEDIRPRLRETLLEQDRVLVNLETADGRPLDPFSLADSGVSNLLSGLTAVLLLIGTLLTAMDLGRWLDAPFARRLLPLRGRLPLLLPRLAAALLPILCFGTLALLAAERPLPCILALFPYLLFWGAAALALALCRPLWSALPAVTPFVPVLGVVLSPMLLDPSVIFPALAPLIRWSPVTLFLRACGGSWRDGAVLAAAGGGLLALAAVLNRKQT